jgi:hypothetical protein
LRKKKFRHFFSKIIRRTIHEGKTMTDDEYSGTKKKAIPLQAWTGPWDSRRLRLPDFETIGT